MSDLEALLAVALAATAEPAAPTPRQVAEAVAVFGLLSDPDARWFKRAVSAERGV